MSQLVENATNNNNSNNDTLIQEFGEEKGPASLTTNSGMLQNSEQSMLMEQECAPLLEKYLAKLIELVPDLKEIDRGEKIRRILFSSKHDTTEESVCESEGNTSSALDGFENLDLNAAKSISDLQILQSVLDYIRDLQSKVDVVESYQ